MDTGEVTVANSARRVNSLEPTDRHGNNNNSLSGLGLPDPVKFISFSESSSFPLINTVKAGTCANKIWF